MQLSTQKLKEFRAATANIKQNSLYPALAYLLIKGGKIYKSSMDTFCSMDIAAEETVMLEQKGLFAFLDYSKSETITINIGKSIELTDANKKRAELPLMDPDSFPVMPVADPEAVFSKLDKQHIDAMFISTNFASELDTATNLRFVHLKSNYISAFDMFKLYFEDFGQELPSMLLLPDEVKILSQFQEIEAASSGNNNFFKVGNFMFSFIKSEYSTPDLRALAEKFMQPGVNISIEKQELIDFCNYANTTGDSKELTCTMNEKGISMQDVNFGKTANVDMDFPGEFEFNFNSRTIIDALKVLPISFKDCTVIKSGIQTGLCVKEGKSIACFAGLKKS